jgi:hypothetical protein
MELLTYILESWKKITANATTTINAPMKLQIYSICDMLYLQMDLLTE